MSVTPKALLGPLLKDVSRSFYTTLRILPGKIRSQIGLAYLLARTTDTVADTDVLPVERRLERLQQLRDRIQGRASAPIQFGEMAEKQSSNTERTLLQNCEAALSLLENMPEADRHLIRQVLDTIVSGQDLDLRRFGAASASTIIALRTDAELDDYTYRVAGCVGEFWTKMCRSHLFPAWPLDEPFMLANGVRFGKGLQLINILRDIPSDLRSGRCYLPTDRLEQIGLNPSHLLKPENEPRMRPLYNWHLDAAEAHLQAGWTYTKSLPPGQMRVRLACAWPILIGFETLKLLRAENVLAATRPIKISRPVVKRLIRRSVLLYPFRQSWERMLE